MRRIALAIAIFAAYAAPAQAAAPPASVTLTACSAKERAAEFEARMGKVGGAARLKMRFTLQVRKPGQKAYHRVDAPGFRTWTMANPGATSWVYSRRVEALLGPARYRAMVRFQWLDHHGKTIAQAKKYSRACRQPDHRPNLKLKALSREGKRRYVALVVNDGRSATGAFDLQVALGALTLDAVSAASLEPGAQRLITMRGPACKTGTAITATADPLDLVDERSETDNALTIPCA
jgi:CARDB protein